MNSNNIQVNASAYYLSEHSEPKENRYGFGYTIRITNNSAGSVQLLDRHWLITDGIGRTQEVKGKGVIGQQPIIEPGGTYEYSSFCPLTTPYGYMEGSYGMVDERGHPFRTEIPMFTLGAVTQRTLN
ncbi:MAG: Co2+/Mg2+ efflux protein ApaG [Trueperaceae bacterium]